MPSPKNLSRWAVLATIEAAANTFQAPAPATDAVLVVERPDVATDYAYGGSRSHPSLRRVPKSGRFHTVDLVHEAAGLGAAYAAAANIPSVHTLLRLAGYDATLNAGAWTYAPTAFDGAFASGSLEVYSRAQKYQLAGAMAALAISGEFQKIPRWTFATRGISQALPADAALAAAVYAGAQAQDAAKAEGLSVTIGAFTPKRVRSFEFSDGREFGNRAADNTSPGRFGGFVAHAERPVTLKLVIESEDLATYNPYQLADQVDNRVLTLPVGATATKRWKLTADNAQLVDTPEQDEDNAAMWELNFELKPSTFGGADTHRFLFD